MQRRNFFPAHSSKTTAKGGRWPPFASACQKSLAEFAAISGEDVSIIFGRGVYVD